MSRMATIDAFFNTRSKHFVGQFEIAFPGLCMSYASQKRSSTHANFHAFRCHSFLGIPAFWASPLPNPYSVLGIPFSYYCSVLGIPLYPPGMPKSLVFWSSPLTKFWISRENRKSFRDDSARYRNIFQYLKRRFIRKALQKKTKRLCENLPKSSSMTQN